METQQGRHKTAVLDPQKQQHDRRIPIRCYFSTEYKRRKFEESSCSTFPNSVHNSERPHLSKKNVNVCEGLNDFNL